LGWSSWLAEFIGVGRSVRMRSVLFRFAYIAVSNGLAMLRLLPMSDRAKDVELLALRHQITVLERRAGRPTIVRMNGRGCRGLAIVLAW
jgi:hypothetical protein